MIQYIDKSALVAEIKRRYLEDYNTDDAEMDEVAQGVLASLMFFLDTLEVKEVDLEKEYEEFVVDDPIFGNFITNDTMGMELAKHFFELGLNTGKEE